MAHDHDGHHEGAECSGDAATCSCTREDFDRGVFEVLDAFLAANPGGQERLIPLLHRAQEHIGYLPFEVQEYVADRIGLSPVQVYGVVSFYSFFTTVPRGRYQIKVCMGTACFVRNAQRLVDAIEETLAMKSGEISEDRLFNLEQVRCIGACGLAPAMTVNEDVHGNLTPVEVRKLVKRLRGRARKEAAAEQGIEVPVEEAT